MNDIQCFVEGIIFTISQKYSLSKKMIVLNEVSMRVVLPLRCSLCATLLCNNSPTL